jgi:hypothetical protein
VQPLAGFTAIAPYRASVIPRRLPVWYATRHDASDALALDQPVYAWFIEGFELPDLVEAREFLGDFGSA